MRARTRSPQAGKSLYKAYRFELKHLRAEQEVFLRCFAGAARFCYNALLALCVEDYAEYLEELDSRQCWGEAQSRTEARALTLAPLSLRGQFALNYELKALKQAHPFLRDCHSQVLQQKLADLHQSYENFFAGRSGRPQFKKKGGSNSIRYPQGFKLEEGNSRLYLPKIGWVNYRNSRRLAGTPKSITVSHRAGKWYVSILCEQIAPHPIATVKADHIVALVQGTACLVKSSEGESFNLPAAELLKLELRLNILRQRLRHKQPHSHRADLLKQRIAKVQKRITDLRLNSIHQITSQLLKKHELIVVPGKGTAHKPGSSGGITGVAGKESRSTLGIELSVKAATGVGAEQDQKSTHSTHELWALFCRMLEYKVLWLS